jgi:hypothetical protein
MNILSNQAVTNTLVCTALVYSGYMVARFHTLGANLFIRKVVGLRQQACTTNAKSIAIAFTCLIGWSHVEYF